MLISYQYGLSNEVNYMSMYHLIVFARNVVPSHCISTPVSTSACGQASDAHTRGISRARSFDLEVTPGPDTGNNSMPCSWVAVSSDE